MRDSSIPELNRIISENLALLDGETSSATERRIALLFDRAALISRDASLLASEERCAEFNQMFESAAVPSDSSDTVKPYLGAYYNCQLLFDKLAVCKFFAERIRDKRDFNLSALLCPDGNPTELLPEEETVPKIAYLKNAYADTAFRRFSEVLGSLSVAYMGDFTSVCEEVYYGRADMCMLPLDSSRDAKLISFCRLINKYELKIVISCDVTSSDGAVTTRYALLKKTLSLPDYKTKEKYDALLLEFSFVPDEDISLADVLFAAENFGLKLYKVDAIPLSYSDSEFSYDVILSCREEKIESFALFMSLAAPQYETLGIYPHFKNK